MRFSFHYLGIPLLALCACQSNVSKEMRDYAATADSTSLSNDITQINSASRKRVKSADVRCRVNNVFAATSSMEQLVTRLGGIVVESNLQNESVQQFNLPYTADSVKQVQLYTPIANITLKVPVEHLDSVVNALTINAAYIDHRVVKDQDMTLKYLANALKKEQHEQQEAQLAKVAPAKKGTTLDVVQYKDQKAEQIIDRQMDNLQINDDVNYSTFTVQLFQPRITDEQIVVNPERLTRAGFGTELLVALRTGADVFRNILLFFIQLWPFLLAAALGWFGYRKVLLRKS
ncbi:DUF4349 domain-containing protein [Chitinophaga arvensicola]|uniref:DUF4349 domain-containing protein n=1 Tax=Chitinophaga arvensicola TaxID=29529 RepID=A0A1I0S9A2_9BACT|nr:DUF4349 domain-containing protein [Chitinophaga arvensicola]SEW52604.1 protein of unknown function [Chitinophaga arvensicola]